jgi:alkylation response protein AidB-like acyl-CoA dehydrogenase
MKSDEQVLLETAVRRFAERGIAPHLDDLNHYPDRPLPEGFLAGLGELGLLDIEPRTGVGLLASALRELAYAAAAPAALVFAHALGRHLVLEAGREATGLCAYPIYGEQEAPELHYVEDRDALVVDGTCQLVAGAPFAETLVLPASGPDGVALLVLQPGTAGLEVGSPLLTLGMRGCPTADVSLSAAPVTADRLVRNAGALFDRAHALFRAPAAAIAAGVLARSIRTATEYARERYQGGQNIIDHQEVRRLLAGMLADEELCRSAVERLPDGTAEPAATELFLRAKERAARATCDGVQLLGGYGYMEDYGQERCMRDAKQAEYLLGRPEMLRQQAMERWLA